MADREKTEEIILFLFLEQRCCLSATLKIIGSKTDPALRLLAAELPTSAVVCHGPPKSPRDFSDSDIWQEPLDMDDALASSSR
jgi:hypothetical protein